MKCKWAVWNWPRLQAIMPLLVKIPSLVAVHNFARSSTWSNRAARMDASWEGSIFTTWLNIWCTTAIKRLYVVGWSERAFSKSSTDGIISRICNSRRALSCQLHALQSYVWVFFFNGAFNFKLIRIYQSKIGATLSRTNFGLTLFFLVCGSRLPQSLGIFFHSRNMPQPTLILNMYDIFNVMSLGCQKN